MVRTPDPRPTRSPSRPRSVVLTDWAADVDHLRADRDAIIYQLLILSLLYDEILIQDELLVLSDPLADWFGQREGIRIWEELLDVGSIVILRHPTSAYPTDELRDYSQDHPIDARAKYIQQFGTKDDRRFKPSDVHQKFYSNIEWCLRQGIGGMREAGARRRIEIMSHFSATLRSVLSNPGFSPWLKSCFPSLRHQDISRFCGYVTEPETLVKTLERKRLLRKVLRDKNGQPILNRSLAYQGASLFPSAKEAAFRQIVQSAFAVPFCWRENAVGRYGGILKAVPPPMTQPTSRRRLHTPLVTVDAHVNVPIAMPRLEPGFSEAVAAIRETPAGKSLRDSVARLGQSATFEEQKLRWQAVAEELANRVAVPCRFGVSIDTVAGA